ncbi:MAG: hypothetical protein RR477_08925, partial [Raoultibacter sp.]
GGDRARDLIDLQLIFASTNVELAEVKNVCMRLFRYRDKQSWPPIVTKGDNWDLLYASQSEIFSVKSGVDGAIEWVNELIVRIDKAQLVPVS